MASMTTPQTDRFGVWFAPKEVIVHYRADETILLRSPIPLTGVVGNIVDYLEQWASEAPARLFLAQRRVGPGWNTLTYAQAWLQVQGVAQALLDQGLNATTPIAILSGASLEHAVLSFAAMLVGIPVAPISPNYSLLPAALPRLVEIAEGLQPACVFVQSAKPFAGARSIPRLAAAHWISATPDEPGTTLMSDLYPTPLRPDLEAARRAVTHETVAKVLFTSGSTGSPKGVINTQSVLCSAVAASGLIVVNAQLPVLLDWLPWHHTIGGNAVLHGVLREGGTLYIDNGRPTPADFSKTIENIRDVKPTFLVSVPAALQMLADALEADHALCEAFFSRLRRVSFAGASLPQAVWERIQALAVRTLGTEIAFGSGYGSTETGPGISVTHWPSRGGGEIGLPNPGLTIKLVPIEDRFEVRVRGPNVMPGYLGRPDLTAAAFDDEGFYRVGDLVKFVDPANPAAGLRFAGRLSENFKLTNGSWVVAGELRGALLEACRPEVSDLVIAGLDRNDLRLMIWVHPAQRLQLGGSADGLLEPRCYAALAASIAERLRAFNATAGGATHRIAAFRILHHAPSIGAGETTDKGYVNQRGVLHCRADLVHDLYATPASSEVIIL